MKGAIAELCATVISAPIRNRLIITGNSHQRLLLQKKDISSPATPRFRVALRTNFMTFSFRVRYRSIFHDVESSESKPLLGQVQPAAEVADVLQVFGQLPGRQFGDPGQSSAGHTY